MTIQAKYPGTCGKCNGAITPGQKIEWSKGSRPTHTTCGATASPPKTGGGSGTCSCGRAIDPKYTQCYRCANPSARRRPRMGSGHGSAAPVRGYSSYCTDNANCHCYDCSS